MMQSSTAVEFLQPVTPERPFVSVIVPVYNGERSIRGCLQALLNQTYPRDLYEVIVVDNGSSDATRALVGQYPVTLLVEDQTQSSYAARNKGINHARGTILAFTDADCTPAPGWIAAGLAALDEQQADLAGGHVHFVYSPRPSGAELYDSVVNLQVERSIRERNAAQTANLFVRASVFQVVGQFPSTLQSGGDIFWTQRATAAGFKLVYARAAEISHPTRRLRELLKKQYRVGRGHRGKRAQERQEIERRGQGSRQSKLEKALERLQRRLHGVTRGFLPLPLSFVRESLRQNQIQITQWQLYRAWFVGWLARAVMMVGRLSIIRTP